MSNLLEWTQHWIPRDTDLFKLSPNWQTPEEKLMYEIYSYSLIFTHQLYYAFQDWSKKIREISST